MPQTSQQWWDSTKNDPEKLIDWLKKQYHGEVTASDRIISVFSRFDLSPQTRGIILRIAREELQHALWVAELLEARGVEPQKIAGKNERYWEQTMRDIDTIEKAAAVAHHAEHMRLERIRAIVDDPETPDDIRLVFKRILPMEVRHDRWFEKLSTPEAIETTRNNHELGRQALGLEA